MNSKLFTLLLVASMAMQNTGSGYAFPASPGPQGNFDKNAVWNRPDVNGVDANALATRGILYFDMANPVGAKDRITSAIAAARRTNALSQAELSDLQDILVIADVLADNPDALDIVKTRLLHDQASPHRSDLALLLADLMLEQGLAGDARTTYEQINIDALSPNLRDDYLYHLGFSDLLLANYAEAAATFSDTEVLRSETYGNAARFYLGYISYVDRDYNKALQTWDTVNTATMPGKTADYYRAQIAYFEGRYDEALRLARPLLSDTDIPAIFTAEANRVVGEAYYQKGDPGQAISYLKKYVAEVESPERSTLYILGLAQYNEGQYKAAVESLTPVTSDRSAMGQSAYLYIGQALLKLGDDNGAMLAFNQALTMNFDRDVTENAYYNYAVAKSRGGGIPFASSVSTFEDFLSRFPDSRYADQVAGYIVTGYVTDGNYEAALKSINKVSKPSPSILAAKQKVLYMLGSKNLAADKVDDAVKMLRQAKELGKYDASTAAETNLLLGEALYRTGDYDGSASALLEYLDMTDANNPNRAVARYDLGYTRMAQRNWPKAQTNFERVIAAPGDLSEMTIADAQSRLGDVLYYQRNWAKAAAAYDGAYNIYPEAGDYPLYQKAVMQGYNRDYTGKLSSLQTLLKKYPTSALIPDALMEEAEAYVQLGQPDKANAVYSKLIADYSETTQGRRAYLFLAARQAGNGETDKAIETYQNLIRLASTSDEAHQADEAVKRLHADRGTLDQYNAFIATVDGARAMKPDEAQTLAWNAAERSYVQGKGTSLLEKYVNDYPKGKYAPRALTLLMEDAEDNDNTNLAYKWASMLITNFPDNAATEDALIVKGDIDYERGRGMDALRSWEMLDQKASSPEYKNIARMGILRVARDMGDASRIRSAADDLLKSTTLGSEEKTEALFSRALAMSLEGETEGAISSWKELASNPDDLYGAKAAVYAAEELNESNRFAEAEKLATDFVNSGTPHTYWLARGFIALSDALSGQGRNFEAKEYIKALKENYPGNEADITDMIEERLQ